jgi:hypothetical protein
VFSAYMSCDPYNASINETMKGSIFPALSLYPGVILREFRSGAKTGRKAFQKGRARARRSAGDGRI